MKVEEIEVKLEKFLEGLEKTKSTFSSSEILNEIKSSQSRIKESSLSPNFQSTQKQILKEIIASKNISKNSLSKKLTKIKNVLEDSNDKIISLISSNKKLSSVIKRADKDNVRGLKQIKNEINSLLGQQIQTEKKFSSRKPRVELKKEFVLENFQRINKSLKRVGTKLSPLVSIDQSLKTLAKNASEEMNERKNKQGKIESKYFNFDNKKPTASVKEEAKSSLSLAGGPLEGNLNKAAVLVELFSVIGLGLDDAIKRMAIHFKSFKNFLNAPIKSLQSAFTRAKRNLKVGVGRISQRFEKLSNTFTEFRKGVSESAGKMIGKVKDLATRSKTMISGGAKSLIEGFKSGLGSIKGALSSVGSTIKKTLTSGLQGAVSGIKKISSVVKKAPVIGSLLSAGIAAKRFKEGDVIGGGLELASGLVTNVPWAGTAASIGIDIFNEKLNKESKETGKSKRDLFGEKTGGKIYEGYLKASEWVEKTAKRVGLVPTSQTRATIEKRAKDENWSEEKTNMVLSRIKLKPEESLEEGIKRVDESLNRKINPKEVSIIEKSTPIIKPADLLPYEDKETKLPLQKEIEQKRMMEEQINIKSLEESKILENQNKNIDLLAENLIKLSQSQNSNNQTSGQVGPAVNPIHSKRSDGVKDFRFSYMLAQPTFRYA